MSLAIQRTSEFAHNKKIVMASTPTIKGISRIELAWLESDQRDYFVTCRKCGHYQVLILGDGTGPGLVWPQGKPEEAAYRCAGCRELIPHHEKARMVENGEYRARNPSSPIPGFRVSQLISPKRSWGSIAVEFLAAKKSPETLKAFVNTVLAELWEEKHETPMDERALWNRCEPFESEVPDGAALITAGVDVQADRLEVELVGWGARRRVVVDYAATGAASAATDRGCAARAYRADGSRAVGPTEERVLMALTTLTVAQLTANLNALYMALGNPTLRARFPDGREVQYRTVDDIRKAIAETEDAIREASALKTSKSTLAEHRRGDGPYAAGFPPWEHW